MSYYFANIRRAAAEYSYTTRRHVYRMLRDLGYTRLRALSLSTFSLGEYQRYFWDSGLSLMLFREHRNRMDVFSECYFGKNYLNQSVKCIVDIGAHTGSFSWSCYNLLKPHSIYLYEPNLDLAPHLSRVASKMTESEVHIRNVAIGEKNTNIDYYKLENPLLNSPLGLDESMNGLLRNYASPLIQKSNVQQVTLDEELEGVKQIDILKMDTQGYEINVLNGATATLAKTRIILTEINFLSSYAGGATFCPVHDFLTKAGFLLVQLDSPSRSKGICVWTDALYVSGALV